MEIKLNMSINNANQTQPYPKKMRMKLKMSINNANKIQHILKNANETQHILKYSAYPVEQKRYVVSFGSPRFADLDGPDFAPPPQPPT